MIPGLDIDHFDEQGRAYNRHGERTHDELATLCQKSYYHTKEGAEECNLFHNNPDAWEEKYGHRTVRIDGEPVGVVYSKLGSYD